LAWIAIESLTADGQEVVVEGLCRSGFSAALTERDRATYYAGPFDAGAVQPQVQRLLAAEALVLVFPTWWFGFPAVLKGWFDRVWAPGVAYDHASDFGPLRPRLGNLRRALAVTSLGSSWWVDKLLMRQPVRRVLKTALLGTCAPACRFDMLLLYRAERSSAVQVQRFSSPVRKAIVAWG
jgi:putative NADPH-quinone reductase